MPFIGISVTTPCIPIMQGTGAVVPFSPLSLNPLIWLDSDLSYITMSPNPNIQNGTFSVDASWSKGTGWSIGGGTANHSPWAAPTAIEQAANVITGNYYRVTFDLTVVNAGNVAVRFGTTQGTLRGIVGTYIENNFASSPKLGLITPAATSLNGSCDNFIAEQLSLTTITPRVNVGGAVWNQAVASQQPYIEDVGGYNSISSVRTRDHLMIYTGNAADFNSLHNGSGTFWCVFNPKELTGIVPGGNLSNQNDRGIYPYLNANGSIRFVIGNGSGVSYCLDVTSAIGLININTTYILIQRWGYPTNYEVYLGGNKIIDSGYTAAPSALDATNTVDLFTAEGSAASDSSIRLLNYGIIDRRITDTELVNLGEWLANNVGGSWV